MRAGGEVKDECFGKSRGEEAVRVKERDFTPQALKRKKIWGEVVVRRDEHPVSNASRIS